MQSRSHIQQTLPEIVYIVDWCLVDFLLHHAPHYNRHDSYLDCSEAIMWEERSVVCRRLWIRGLSTVNAFTNGASASGLAWKQKEDILNIFFN